MHGEISFYQNFYWSLLILCKHNVDTLNICMKKFDAKRFELSHYFNTLHLNKDFVSAQIVHAQLLLKPSDTLHAQCRHIEHLHEGVWGHKNTSWQNDCFWTFVFTICFLKEKDQKQINRYQIEVFLKQNCLVQISCKSDYKQESYWRLKL